LHGEAAVGTDYEAHQGLAGRLILGGLLARRKSRVREPDR
jgi:hypothetical protein